MKIILVVLLVLSIGLANGQSLEKNTPPANPQILHKSSERPDRIILTFGENAERDRTVTWRTSASASPQILEITENEGQHDFYKTAKRYEAQSSLLVNLQQDSSLFHKVKLKDLEPGKLYSYRVGGSGFWSSWMDINMQIQDTGFRFIFMGDAQNDLFSLWSRVIRKAFDEAPDASMVLHVGDLINHSQNDYEWAEWFEAAGPILNRLPQVAVPGNHEYIKDESEKKVGLSPFWNAQFNFPENGPNGLEDQAYYLDYYNCRFIMLNSNEKIELQANWLEGVLAESLKKWIIVMFHHPVLSGADGRVNEGVLKFWKPLLDKYKVDLVLQGHDHVYGRGNKVNSGLNEWDENSGTTYVVAVSGRKMYPLGDHPWMQKKQQDLQTYQVISVTETALKFEAFKSNGEIFDAFEILKSPEGPNIINELLP
ncbi:purple acid phosphatase family protein [Cecembia rubra]|uniref:purple acid phosphatase family protein n=1 Tax=Cecembia rubra TaxID=1485585 RepID=UPI00271500F2|nr:metallophosphoesterase family protein [Cecembia rubra]